MRPLEDPALFLIAYAVLVLPAYAMQIFGLEPTRLIGGLFGGHSEWNTLVIPYLTFYGLTGAVAWLRGIVLDRRWLVAFPGTALLLSFLPIPGSQYTAPTIVHFVGVIVGLFPRRSPAPPSGGPA
jgi:hypothetical protein